MTLVPHSYRYFPYELDLAAREYEALAGPSPPGGVFGGKVGNLRPRVLNRLTYFAGVNGATAFKPTQQFLLEGGVAGRARQSTRYSVHGLHEYKGKFNPQVVRSVLNIFNVNSGERVLDPFCGSGTTLVECAHLGIHADGADINPLAVFVANAKLEALGLSTDGLSETLNVLIEHVAQTADQASSSESADRSAYLADWFPPDVLATIERLRTGVGSVGEAGAPFFLAIASNLLRDYSLQEPADLRIRRRKTPLPDRPFLETFASSAAGAIERLRHTQRILGVRRHVGTAARGDISIGLPNGLRGPYDAAITSPPYATALPYIDTQRLSLVWLGLIAPREILPLEAELVGSRELRGSQKRVLIRAIENNDLAVPERQWSFCMELERELSSSDGFRRKVVPLLVYRYFASMRNMFRAVKPLMKDNAPFALVVGSNHTVLGGRRFEVDTPNHLADLAVSMGWVVTEKVELQTYRRYGLHAANAIQQETLLLLRSHTSSSLRELPLADEVLGQPDGVPRHGASNS